MCGIAGIVGMYSDENIINDMLLSMRRRGPDGQGVYRDETCTMLHTRLSIIDLTGGKQPMSLHNNNETYIISYNGELYNTQEVRSRLERIGHVFNGHSDTEVVLHAYVQWGERALDILNGIFAFGVWEKNRKRLFLARDRIGVKPLFYIEKSTGLIFASEIKTLLKHPQITAKLDAQGIGELLLLGPGRTPGSGVFHGVKEMEPGCFSVFENARLTVRQYWSLKDREHTDSFSDTVESVRSMVLDAIHSQMVSDVPLGTFLSGGLDSSIISAVCAAAHNADDPLKTFSVDYVDNDKYFVPGKFQPNSDASFIEIMKKHILTEHRWTVLSYETLIHCLEDATRARDLPGMADVDFSLLAFCNDIRANVKVALSGECADEIFGGYPWFRDPDVRATQGFPWAQNTKLRACYIHKQHRSSIAPEEFVNDRYSDTINHTDVLPGVSAEERRIKEMVNLNYRWFMQTLLDRKDRMSMYNGLEVRVPFCDYRIAEYMYAVPWKYKDHKGIEKGLLRTAMQGILPEKILWRKKSPYPKTYDPGYLLSVSQMLRDVVMDKQAPIHQIVDADALNSLLEAEYEWPWYGQLMKVPQTIAYMLQINFWLKDYRVEIV